MSDFKKQFENYLEDMIPRKDDSYKEIRYNNNIYIHVCSHDEGKDYFELELMIPHSEEFKNNEQEGVLNDVPGFESFLEEAKDVLSKKTDNVESALNFQFLEGYDEGEYASISEINPPHDLYSSLKTKV